MLSLCLALALTSPPVATIQTPHGEVVISEERLQSYAAANPNRNVRDLLQDLVSFELLAQEAAAESIDASDDPGLKAALVRQYLKSSFEMTWSKETLPKEYVERAYQTNLGFYVHPELRDAAHVLVTTSESKMPLGDHPKEAALQQATAIYDALRASEYADKQAFMDAAKEFKSDVESTGFVLKIEDVSRFALVGQYVQEFSNAAFQTDVPGSIVGPVATQFGYHIIYVADVIAPINKQLPEVEDEIRDRILNDVRAFKLRTWLNEQGTQRQTMLDMSPLNAVEARRGTDVLTSPDTP